jgi:hypothetical protein
MPQEYSGKVMIDYLGQFFGNPETTPQLAQNRHFTDLASRRTDGASLR